MKPAEGPEVLEESWLALEQLFERGTLALDEAALVEKLCRRLARRRWRQRRRLAILAASLLAGVGLCWLALARQGSLVARQGTLVAAVPRVLSQDVAPPIASHGAPVVAVKAVQKERLLWDDGFDEQLLLAQAQIDAVEKDWHRTPDALWQVWQRLNELEQEISPGSL